MKRPFPREYQAVFHWRSHGSKPYLTIMYEGNVMLKVDVSGTEKQLDKVEGKISAIRARQQQADKP